MRNLFVKHTWYFILIYLFGQFLMSGHVISQVTADFDFDQNCNIVQFNDLSQISGLATITGYLWAFDDGTFSTFENPEHTFLTEGSYEVELRVYFSDGGDDDSTSTFQWIHYFNPIASFSADDVCFGNVTMFQSEAITGPNTTIDPDEMVWDFENNGLYTATGFNVMHTYDSPGMKNVLFQVSNDIGCIHDTVKIVEIFQIPEASFSFLPGCPGAETFFTDASVPNSMQINEWQWDFGDGSPISNEQHPGHTYAGNGIYDVNLLVINSNGCIDDTTQAIVVEMPAADFEYDQVCAGKVTSFTDLSVFNNLPITSWQWDFGDMAGTSTLQHPQYTYSTHGVYEVELIAGNSQGCYDTVVHQVLVDSLPVAGFIYGISCEGVPTCFSDTSVANGGNIISWLWNFGDGNSSILQNPCHVYINTGEYNVTLIVTNSNGCESDPYEATILVSHEPLASFENNTACFGDVTHFTNLTDTMGVEIAYWLWDFGDPASGDENTSNLYEPVHLFTGPGTYQVQLMVENIHGCFSVFEKVVEVIANPEAMFVKPDTIAVGVQFNVNDQSIGLGAPIIMRFWDFGDGNTATNINPVIHTYTEPGEYMICLTVEDFYGCTDQFCDSIVVTGLPTADFIYASDVTYETYFFDESQPDNTIIDWFWDFGDLNSVNDTISGVPNPIWQYSEEGWYTVILKITDKYGGIDEISKMIYAGKAVMADFEHFSVCYGDTTIFIDHSYSPISAGIETWFWDFGDGHDTTYHELLETLNHRYALPGVYQLMFAVSTTVSGFFMSDTLYQTIEIFEKPYPRIKDENLGVCFGKPIHFKDASVYAPGDPGTSWLWDFQDGSYSGQKNPVHLYTDTGSYQVTLRIMTQHGCTGIDTAIAYVSSTPNFGFEVRNNCLHSPAQFIPLYDSSKITITSWNWNFGDNLNPDNTSTLARPYHIYSKIDVYEVTMKMEAYGCSGESKKTILIYPIPYSDFSLTPNYEGIQGKTKFDNHSVLSTNYFWDFGNGNTSTEEHPVEVFEFDSTFTITLIAFNEYACSDTTRHSLYVFFRGLYFPTAFSPNNPNREISRFAPKGINLVEYTVQVFDLKGNLMWESDELDLNGSPLESWDGYTRDGILMPQGMYVWKAHGIFRDGSVWRGQAFYGEEPKTSGVVTLIH
jgi:PKD repeat protein